MATFNSDSGWFPKIRGRYVTYLRTSNRPHSKLDINAQRKAVTALLSKGRARQLAEFEECEPLVDGERPQLEEAIAMSKSHGATLVFGKLDRMRGRVRLLDRLFEQNVKFRAADLPYLYSYSFYQLQSDNSDTLRMMSKRVKETLARKKQEGVKLGGRRANAEGLKKGPAASAKSRQRKARFRDSSTMSYIKYLQVRGVTSLAGIATRLNQMRCQAPRGGSWSATQVRRVIDKFEQ